MKDLTAAQLITSRCCTPQCLTATGMEARHCGCGCGGRWHGVLASAAVPGSACARAAEPATAMAGQGDVLAFLDEMEGVSGPGGTAA